MTDIKKRDDLISLIIPCYNEEAVLPNFWGRIQSALSAISDCQFEFIFINDGSSDGTQEMLSAYAKNDVRVRVVEFSRNFGKEAALSAGIDCALGDAVIPIDADLQDPPELMVDMVRLWREGAQVVAARRKERSTDSFAKRFTAEMFYRVHNSVAAIKIPENVGDYRLMDRAVVEALKRLPEKARFMKGLFAWVGFRTEYIDYSRETRAAGESKFSGAKLWNFALEGVTSFSAVPLKIWTYIGLLTALGGMIYAAIIGVRTLILGIDVPGYASLIIAILFFNSLNMIGIGVLGEYISRIFLEVKNRPLYIVKGTQGEGFDETHD